MLQHTLGHVETAGAVAPTNSCRGSHGSGRSSRWHRFRLVVVLLAMLGFVPVGIVGAQDDLWFSWDEDDLFGSTDPLLVEGQVSSASPADELLAGQPLSLGGDYAVSYNAGWMWSEPASGLPIGPEKPHHSQSVGMGGTLYADIRPNKDERIFAKGRYNVDTAHAAEFRLTELFGDFHYDDRVFFRAGKQAIHWGVGYFFSPADIVNVGRIDPQDPTADREGPIALKVHVPVGSHNVYTYAIAGEKDGQTRLALAPKVEWVVGRSELGLGAFYQARRAPRIMGTLSTTWGKVSLFGEAVVSYGSDKTFIQDEPTAPWGVAAAAYDERLFSHATAGARYSYDDAAGNFNVSGAVQYAYNGEGYDGTFLQDRALGVAALLQQGSIEPGDLRQPGRHYAAAAIAWTSALRSKLSPNVFWLGNLSDGSGLVSSTLTVVNRDHINVAVGLSRGYGRTGTEYAPLGRATTVFVNVGLGRVAF